MTKTVCGVTQSDDRTIVRRSLKSSDMVASTPVGQCLSALSAAGCLRRRSRYARSKVTCIGDRIWDGPEYIKAIYSSGRHQGRWAKTGAHKTSDHRGCNACSPVPRFDGFGRKDGWGNSKVLFHKEFVLQTLILRRQQASVELCPLPPGRAYAELRSGTRSEATDLEKRTDSRPSSPHGS